MQIHVVSICPLSRDQKRRLEKWAELTYYEAQIGDPELGEKCRGAEVLVVTPRLHLDILPYLDQCRLISVQGTGTDAINIPLATAKGIVVCNVPEFCSDAVAEHAFALLLAVARHIELGREILREGKWIEGLAYQGKGLTGRTLGILGLGKIGRRVARIGRGFGMRIIATTKHPDAQRERDCHLSFVSFERLLAESDYVILTLPATPETKEIFGAGQLARMKPAAIIINVSRGSLIDELALADALREGRLAGAGLDVFSAEPPPKDHPLLNLPQAIVTPHVAWGTAEAVKALLDGAIANVEDFLESRPQNVVNPEVFRNRAAPFLPV